MLNDIRKIDNEWSKLTGTYDFLGERELALNLDQYEYYFKLYREQCIALNAGVSFFLYSSVLVILAVNCAYFEYDNSGFWVHFLRKMGLEKRPDLQETIGKQIENYLIDRNFLERKRAGSFRYVGAILEQTGVTRRHLPRFVEFLKFCVNRVGWSGLIVISPYSFEKLLPETGMSKYLINFLRDPAGIEFVTSVARSLEQSTLEQFTRQQSQLDFLLSLKGYRPSFWKELLKLFDQDISRVTPARKSNAIPGPKYVYQPNLNNRFAIIFDEENVRLLHYRFNDDLVLESSIQLFDTDDFEESYDIEIKEDDYEWSKVEIRGWSPEKRPHAFFDSDSGVLLDLNKNISTGEYYLAISDNYIEKLSDENRHVFNEIIIRECGWINTVVPLKGFLVQIRPDTDLSFLGLKIDGTEKKLLAWDKGKRLECAGGFDDVFVGAIPNLITYQPDLFMNKELLLAYDIGNGKEIINDLGRNGFVSLSFSPIVKGKIWAEPIGRQKSFYKYRSRQLSFCCLPLCEINWPENLLAYNERPQVKIESESDMSISFSGDCTAIDDSKKEWVIPPEQTFIEGLLRVGSITIAIVKRLLRASMLDDRMSRVGTVILEDFLNKKTFFLTGNPGSPAKLFLNVNNHDKLLADLGKFDQAGKILFTSDAVKDSLRNFHFPVGEIKVGYNNKAVSTGTKIYNPTEIFNQLCHVEASGFGWIDDIAPSAQEPIRILKRAIDGKITHASLKICEDLPEGVKEWGEEILLCSCFFDRTRVEEYDSFLADNRGSVTFAFGWLEKVRALLSVQQDAGGLNDKNLIKELDKITWRPPVKRWVLEFEQYISKLKIESELFDVLLEWKDEVLSPGVLVEYQCRLAQMLSGRELVNAWKKYRKGKLNEAYGLCSRILDDSISPVSDLATILMNILFYKHGTPEQINQNINHCHDKLAPLLLKSIALGTKKQVDNDDELCDSSYLPLLDEDKEIL